MHWVLTMELESPMLRRLFAPRDLVKEKEQVAQRSGR